MGVIMRALWCIGAVTMALAIALGAFGAHGLAAMVSEKQLAVWKTATQYQAYGGLGLLLMGTVWAKFPQHKGLKVPAILLLLGVVCFSGSLYGLVLTQQSWLGPITPLGGVLMILSWLWFAVLAWRLR